MLATENPLVEQLQEENSELRGTIAKLTEQLRWFERQVFGKRAERFVPQDNPSQMYLPGFEPDSCQPEQSQKQEVPAHQRSKGNRQGQDKIQLPDHLPIETTVLDLHEEEKVCPKTGTPLVKIGEEVSDKLAQKAATFFIKRTIRPKYALPEGEGILTALLPDSIIPRCRADESFLAHLLTQKFADHLPLYRISQILQREEISISRKLLSSWVVRLGVALKPLRDLMLEKILASNNLFIDESPVTFLEDVSQKGYMWALAGGEGPNPAHCVYFFKENRRHAHVEEILKGYRGTLHSDKYGAYESLAQTGQILWCPCWAHIRRKFFDIEMGDLPFKEWMLLQIHTLFELERSAWASSPEERLQIRQQQEVPLIDEMIAQVKSKLIDGKILPKSKLKEALGYFLSLSPYLKNYTKSPHARLDNNVAERAIRPLAIGRKNWLFFGSVEAGEAAAIVLSLVQSCRNLGINPREYLEDLLRRFMSHSAQHLDELLPDQWLLSRSNTR